MNELYQLHDAHGRPKIADNIYCFQLPSPEPPALFLRLLLILEGCSSRGGA